MFRKIGIDFVSYLDGLFSSNNIYKINNIIMCTNNKQYFVHVFKQCDYHNLAVKCAL